jgi:hypothetical protein
VSRFRERPSSWYDPPDEPSDAEEERCHAEWLEYLFDFCESCAWTAEPDTDRLVNADRCADCLDYAPDTYDAWCADWHDDERRRNADAAFD